MSINAKLSRLSIDLHKINDRSPSSVNGAKVVKQGSQKPVAESWEDETVSDTELQSPISNSGEPVEAPGPDIKSPQTKAIDAERELAGELPESMPIPPPTPISPHRSGMKVDWSPANALGGGRPTYTPVSTAALYSNSNLPNASRSTPTTTNNNEASTFWQPPTRDHDADRKRPEKTTATANRMIAGALGIKAPAKTEEQRQYERAVKEQELKRRNREKEERKRVEEDDERAKVAMWEDS